MAISFGSAWGEDSGYYKQCTGVSDIVDGENYIIVYYDDENRSYYAIQPGSASSNCGEIVTQNYGSIIANPDTKFIWTAKGSDGSFEFNNNDLYITCIRTGTALTTNSTTSTTWSIEELGGNQFKISTTFSTTTKYIAFNSQFTTSTAEGASLYIYKQLKKTLQSLEVLGEPDKTTYYDGQALDPTGLVVKGHYNTGEEPITDGIEWTFEPGTLSAGMTSCYVTATFNDIVSERREVTDLTVNATQDIEITSAGWATGCLTFNAKITSGNAVAKYVNVSNSTLTKTDVTNIKAGEGFLLKSNSGAGCTVTFEKTADTLDETTGNMMLGTTLDGGEEFSEYNTTYFILANDAEKGGIGFYYQGSENTTGAYVTCAQYKAVLAVPTSDLGSGVKGFSLNDDEFTAVNDIEAVTSIRSTSFNLAGQSVGGDYKGIVIKNGKKCINK